jgi:putative glutamine amidotransferase
MTPIIGITTGGHTESPPTAHYQTHYAVPTHYVDAVRRAGGVPLLLPPGETHWQRWLDVVDAMVVKGGADVDPTYYGGNCDHPHLGKLDPERDATELALTRHLVESDIPSLFICRGHQLLNVALGGSLIEHLPDVIDQDMHRNAHGLWNRHVCFAVPESRLAQMMGTTQVTTYSGHHQAVKTIAPGLTVTASAPDGIIEALEMPSHPWLLAVQWHPEVSAADDPTQQRLFNGLVSAAVQRKTVHVG